jgi:hypothetical protein
MLYVLVSCDIQEIHLCFHFFHFFHPPLSRVTTAVLAAEARNNKQPRRAREREVKET